MAEPRATSQVLWNSNQVPHVCRGTLFREKTSRHSYLYRQADGVEHDEDKHDVLKGCGVHHVPELVLIGVFRDVAPQRSGLKCILHTLSLWGGADRRKQAHAQLYTMCSSGKHVLLSFSHTHTWFLSNSQFRYSFSPCS